MVCIPKVLLYLNSTSNAATMQKSNDGPQIYPYVYTVSDDQLAITLEPGEGEKDYAEDEATTFTLHRVYEKQIGVKEIFERNMRKLLINFVDGYNITFLVVGSTPFNSHMLLLGAKKERIPIGINIGWMDAANFKKRGKQAVDTAFSLRLSVLAITDEHHVIDLLGTSGDEIRIDERLRGGFVLPPTVGTAITSSKDLLEVYEKLKSKQTVITFATLYVFILRRQASRSPDLTEPLAFSAVVSRTIFVDLPDFQKNMNLSPINNLATMLQTKLYSESSDTQEKGNETQLDVFQFDYRINPLTKLLSNTILGNCIGLTLVNLDTSSVSYEDAVNILRFATQLMDRQFNPVCNDENHLYLESIWRRELLSYRRMALVVRDFLPSSAAQGSNAEQSSAIILRLHQEATKLQEEKEEMVKRIAELETIRDKSMALEAVRGTDEETKKELTNLRYKVRILTEVEADLKRRVREMEAEHMDVLTEMGSIRKNFGEMRRKYENECKRGEMIGLELLSVIKSKEALVMVRDEQDRQLKVLTTDYKRLLDEHGKLMSREGRDTQEMITLRAQLDTMKDHLSNILHSVDERLFQFQQQNANLEKQIHDINIAKLAEVQMLPTAMEEQDDGGNDDRQSQINLSTFEGGILKRRVDMLQEQFKDFQPSLNSAREREERLQNEVGTLTKKLFAATHEYRTKLESLARQVANFSAQLNRGDKAADNSAAVVSMDIRKFVQELFQEISKTYVEKEKMLMQKNGQSESQLDDVKQRHDRLLKHQNSLVDQLLRDAATGLSPKDRQTLRDEIRRCRDDLDALKNRVPNEATDAIGSSFIQQQLEIENSELKAQNERLMEQCSTLRNEIEDMSSKMMNTSVAVVAPAVTRAAPPASVPSNQVTQGDSAFIVQQLKMLYLTKQQEWDGERTKLLVRCTIAEQQVESLQEHLRKLKR